MMISTKYLVGSVADTALGLLALGVVPASAEMADWEIDAEHFSIAFEAGHIGYQQQLGFFLEASGNFRYDTETQELSAGRVEVVADSIFSNNGARDNHLKGRDFLNARRNPLIVFEATEFVAKGNDAGILSGNLTMIGKTHPVELEVSLNKLARYPFGHRKETLGISASTTINRSQWGMDYGVANDMVGDLVRLRFEFEAMRQ
jgi:polyisoprenoid-binding protein YceI